ncbi:MAG: hypothetical protein HYU66_16030 [Armatimonadetes bacterium]|nr:hypothetical protein [Armatimonadota bacterium]
MSYQNRLTQPPREYVPAGATAAPFVVENRADQGGYSVRSLWHRYLPAAGAADPAEDKLRVPVKQGDLIGFSVGAHGDYTCDETEWVVTLDYGDGTICTSSDDTALAQGPLWSYSLRRCNTGLIEPLESVEQHDYAGQTVRIASEASGYRAAGGCPHIGPTKCHPANSFDAVRVWCAPRDGTVTITGSARNIAGGNVDLSILSLKKQPEAPPAPAARWELEQGEVQRVPAAGRPALQLNLLLRSGVLRARYHARVYPGTSILRQWLEVENTGAEPAVALVRPLALALRGEGAIGAPSPAERGRDRVGVSGRRQPTSDTPLPPPPAAQGEEQNQLPTPPVNAGAAGTYTHYWLVGGNSKPDQGLLQSATVGTAYHQVVAGQATREHVPWVALQREGEPRDGWFAALEYLGPWRLSVDRDASGPLSIGAQAADLEFLTLAAGERRSLPAVTLGVFHGDLDDLSARVYDWQYEYQWDYTNPDYYARPKWAVPWFYCSRNLQEQFAGRLAGLDMDADLMREIGFEMLWDDAGWSTFPGWPDDNYGSVFRNTYEGPDFAQTLRYLPKVDMRWLLWFAGRPTSGVMDTKVGSWGNFEWRTDAVDFPGLASDEEWRARILHFLDAHPRCSFHTCSGGSTYAHTFDIQRYATTNYFADFGRGPQTNYYLSYLDPPDKWVDIIEPWGTGGKYAPDTARQLLTMVPMWGLYAAEADREPIRRLVEIYHYLLREGVAGRWSFVCHPEVKGDTAFYYFQRLSHDRTKSCVILKHRSPDPVTVFPRGLLPEHRYVVGLDSTRETTQRTGADLMAHGIALEHQQPGELIWLGLAGRPGGGHDTTPPTAPGRVLTRRETNLGHTGTAVYWSPGHDESWISYHEVRRGDTVLGRAATGCCYFDHSPGWATGAAYAVRAVDGDGNASPWTPAEPLPDEPLTASALGGHFAEPGRDGWSAETTTDNRTFVPMTWVAPVKTPAGDMGGTPNQVGGVEGYWEGAGTARVGRGWQQASATALCVRSWTAPRAGTVRVVGRAIREWYRQEREARLWVRILSGTEPVWATEGWAEVPSHDLVGAVHDFTLPVAAGDCLRFVLYRCPSPDDAVVAWMPRIVYQEPEPPTAGSVVRILCGARKPYTDACGNVWSADRCYSGGRAMAGTLPIAGAQPTPQDAALYQAGRQGSEFTYAIPVLPGLYTVRLKLAETQYKWAGERPFHLEINGRRVLTGLDVVHAARGPGRAHERVFRYLVPDAEGRLVLRFLGGSEPTQSAGRAMVQAIEVLPELTPAVRIDVGAEAPFIDWNSFVWDADAHVEGGRTIRSGAPVSQASPTLYDQALYQTARSGRSIRYAVPVPPGLYTVHLKFAELWLPEPGRRPMTILVNGRRVREAWDPATAAGQVGMAADFRVDDTAPNQHGHIVVEVRAAGPEDAILQGLELE